MQEIVDQVNKFQRRCVEDGLAHPLTCGDCPEREDVLKAYVETTGRRGRQLIILICPKCGYEQILDGDLLQCVLGMADAPTVWETFGIKSPGQ